MMLLPLLPRSKLFIQLDPSTRIYTRVCLSVGPSAGGSGVFNCAKKLYIRGFVHRSIGTWVTRFFNIAKTGRIQVDSSKF